MTDHELIPTGSQLAVFGTGRVPAIFHAAGDGAVVRFMEFFAATIRNPNTREAYFRAVCRFSHWCEARKLRLEQVSPLATSLYIEELGRQLDVPSVKQHLAAIKMLMDWLVTGHIIATNPAASVRGPRLVISKGKTPVLSTDEARELIESIDLSSIVGLRDRALIATMIYSFARIGAVVAMDVQDYFVQGRRMWFRLHEKGGKVHDVPTHHKAEEFLDRYVEAAGIGGQTRTPLFRTVNRHRELTDRRLSRREALAIVKRRAANAGLSPAVCNHSFRATGITAYLQNGGSLEHAQRIAAHASPKTTKLYDRTSDEITLDEIERILI